jgi:hypothetical protein
VCGRDAKRLADVELQRARLGNAYGLHSHSLGATLRMTVSMVADNMTQATIELKLWGLKRTGPTPTPRKRASTWVASPWLWCVLGVMVLVIREIAGGSSAFLKTFGDTDDAMRLVQVREFLAGAGWYDLVLPRFGGATPLVSHWSRLIDVPIALLLVLFGSVLSADAAEIATRAVWPSLVLLVLLRVLMFEAAQRGGRIAAIFALLFAVTTLSGVFQFRLGRIDHHNVMILGTLAGLLRLTRAFDTPSLGYVAGGWIGLALSVGYEPLALALPLIGVAALAASLQPDLLRAVRNLVLGLTATLCLGLLVSTPPSLWHLSACDAISVNLVVLAAVGAAGLTALEAYGRRLWWPTRVLVLAAVAAAGAVAFLAFNPACIGGPFAEVGAEARLLWLTSVRESQGLMWTFDTAPTAGFVFLVFAAAGVGSAIERYRRRRTTEAAAVLVLMVLAIAPVFLAMKFLAYASFIAAFCIALSVADATGTAALPQRSSRLLGLLMLNQWTLAVGVTSVLMLFGVNKSTASGSPEFDTDVCSRMVALRPLGQLPQGLIVAHIDLGPALVALTHHDVLAGPYHRIDQAIAETQLIFRSDPTEALARLTKVKARYVVNCVAPARAGTPVTLEQGLARTSLLGRLSHGETVPFLTEIVGVSPEPALRVWRFDAAGPTAR